MSGPVKMVAETRLGRATTKRERGDGSIFKEKYRDKRSGEIRECATWSIKYSVNGKPRKESSGSTFWKKAKGLLDKRLAEIRTGTYLGPEPERTTYEDLEKNLDNDYVVNRRRSHDRVQDACAHLEAYFGGMRALAITPERVTAYVRHRQKAQAANATINRELSALKRMFRLGEIAGLVVRRPYVAMLREDNVRKGFFEPGEFRAVLTYLPDDLKPVFEVAYVTGWRIRSELLSRQWAHVDFAAGWLRLEPGETKNTTGRMFPFTPDLRAVLERQRARTLEAQKAGGAIIPWLFWRTKTSRRTTATRYGVPITSFRRAWR